MTNYDEIREKFFSFLLRRPSTRKQALEFLRRQKIPDKYEASLMSEAEDTGLIDDLGFAKLFVDGHLSWGNMKISYELSMKGISRENINIALDEAEDESDRAYELAEVWQKSGIDAKKITSRLINRGFTSHAVRSVQDILNFDRRENQS